MAFALVVTVGFFDSSEAFPWKGMFSNRDGDEARVAKRDKGDAKTEERPLMRSQEDPVREEHSEAIPTGSRGVNHMEQTVGERATSIGAIRDNPRRQGREERGNGRDVRYATVGSAVYAVKDDDIAVMKGVARSERGEAGLTREHQREVDRVADAVSDRISDRVPERVASEKAPVEVEVRDSEKVEREGGLDESKKEDSTLTILKKEINDMDKPLGPQAERKVSESEHEIMHEEEKTNGWWSMEGKERIREGVLQAMQGLNRLYGALGGGDTAARLVANGSSAEGFVRRESVGGDGGEGIGIEGNGSSRAAAVEMGGIGAQRPVGLVSVVGGVVIVVGVAMLGVNFAQRQGTRGNSNGGGSSGAALYPPRGPSFV